MHVSAQGYLALVLHAHLPYVRHEKKGEYLEERWFYEALTESYIPLLVVCHQLMRDQVPLKITLSLSPTLVSMLADRELKVRYQEHLEGLIKLAEEERLQNKGTELEELSGYYLHNFIQIRKFYLSYHGNLLRAFRELQDHGELELITTAATHAFLPFVHTIEAVRAQVQTGLDVHEHHFGRRPRGMWLPECGYHQKLGEVLREQGVEYFFVDSHGIRAANQAPVFGTFSPVFIPTGIAAFARDEESSKQVWSREIGYPGDFDYREYYRDIGFDRDVEMNRGFSRVQTGIKYFRITGSEEKQLYQPRGAREKAAQHAEHFLRERTQQIVQAKGQMGRKPIVVAPYDAELFGHWWYEGPMWLDFLLRKVHFDQEEIQLITPSEYLGLYQDFQVSQLSMSSWGRDGYGDVWLGEANRWIYPRLHEAENQLQDCATHYTQVSGLEARALNQMARELMLAQSSDWAFIIDAGTMVDYAVKRTEAHLDNFWALSRMLQQGALDASALSSMEAASPIFPAVDYRLYQRTKPRLYENSSMRQRVLMLSWEYPPRTVGGLSRHVHALSKGLVEHGWDVHVVTLEVEGSLEYEVAEGVHLHRVSVAQRHGTEFLDWVMQMNLAMMNEVEQLVENGLQIDVVHAHDWLVATAGKWCKERYGFPLVATIHATEHGRNHGIHTDSQRRISHQEWELTYLAQQVIVCSDAMQQEVGSIFQLPEEKTHIIPNGVERSLGAPLDEEDTSSVPILFFVGRLVYEKGIQTLIEAMPLILTQIPDTILAIAGKGPMQQELRQKVDQLGLQDHVKLLGFVSDVERDTWFRKSAVAVFPSYYEPFGLVALEAMAAGVPVVVSHVGGLAEVVKHEQNGLTIIPGNAESLATQVLRLLTNPSWAYALAETALNEISNYDWSTIALQTRDIYTLAMEKGGYHDESRDHGGGKRNEATSFNTSTAQADGSITGETVYGVRR